jgi:hypothetical protein
MGKNGLKFPQNLYKDIGAYNSDDTGIGVEEILACLSEREKEAILKRYKHRLTYRQIGKEEGVGTAGARVIVHRGLKKLSIEYDRAVADQYPYRLRKESYSIEMLRLSTRAIHVLKRNGVETFGKLLEIPDEEIMKARNCGEQTFCEIKAARDAVKKHEIQELIGMKFL